MSLLLCSSQWLSWPTAVVTTRMVDSTSRERCEAQAADGRPRPPEPRDPIHPRVSSHVPLLPREIARERHAESFDASSALDPASPWTTSRSQPRRREFRNARTGAVSREPVACRPAPVASRDARVVTVACAPRRSLSAWGRFMLRRATRADRQPGGGDLHASDAVSASGSGSGGSGRLRLSAPAASRTFIATSAALSRYCLLAATAVT